MSTSIDVLPLVETLDETGWQAWEAKGVAQDRRHRALREKALAWVSIAALFCAAAISYEPRPFRVGVRFVVTIGAMALMAATLRTKQYLYTAIFAVLVVLYNPGVPVFSFVGNWQRALLALSTIPFLVSLVRRKSVPGSKEIENPHLRVFPAV